MSIAFLTGQRLTADLINANVTAFMPVAVSKSAATDRISTTTIIDDPELQGVALSVGTWEIVVEGLWTQANAAADIATMWGFTGTAAVVKRKCMGIANTDAAAPNLATDMNFSGADTNVTQSYGTSASTTQAVFRESCNAFVVTVAGNFSFQWAQLVSTAANVTMRPGSTITVRRIS